MSALLDHLVAKEVVSEAQCVKGFDRLFSLVPDLILDCPTAPAALAGFTERAVAGGALPRNYRAPETAL